MHWKQQRRRRNRRKRRSHVTSCFSCSKGNNVRSSVCKGRENLGTVSQCRFEKVGSHRICQHRSSAGPYLHSIYELRCSVEHTSNYKQRIQQLPSISSPIFELCQSLVPGYLKSICAFKCKYPTWPLHPLIDYNPTWDLNIHLINVVKISGLPSIRSCLCHYISKHLTCSAKPLPKP